MATPFETFVNDEIGNRVATQDAAPSAGNFPQYTGTAKLTTERTPDEVLADIEAASTLHVSAGWVSGGEVTKPGDPAIDVAAGTGFLRDVDGPTETLFPISWEASNGLDTDIDDITYVGVEWNSGSPQVLKTTNAALFDGQTAFLLATVVNEDDELYIAGKKQFAGDAPQTILHMLKEVFVIRRADELGGLILGETGTLNVTVSEGELYYWGTEFEIDALDTSGADTFDSYAGTTKDGLVDGDAISAWDPTQWDDGGLTAVSNTKWYCHWFYLTLDGSLVSVYGTEEHLNQTAAEAESPPSTVPARLAEHGILIGRYIFKDPPVGYATAADEIQSAFEVALVGSPGAGDVNGPATSTDHALARWNGVGGTLLQDGPVTVDDAGAVAGVTTINMSGNLTVGGTVDGVDVAAHAARHTDGNDDIQNATAGQKGVATAAQITKLDAIEALADVTATSIPTKNKTVTKIVYIQYPEATDSFPITFLADDITMVQVRSVTDVGTVSFNIERRATNSPDVAVANVCDQDGGADDPDLTANAAGNGDAVCTTFLASGAVAAEQWLTYAASAVATSPEQIWIAIEYTID